MSDLGPDFYTVLGRRLRAVREKSGLSMRTLGSRLGLKRQGCASYFARLEKGRLHNIGLATIVGYLNACNEPIEQFFLDLFADPLIAQGLKPASSLSADVAGLTERKRKGTRNQARARELRRMRKQARKDWLADLCGEVEPIVRPYLVGGHASRLDAYVKVADEMFRTGKRIMEQGELPGEAEALKAELDRIEGRIESWFLNPEAVRLVRKAMEHRLGG